MTGEWTLMLKVKMRSTRTLEQLIDRIRAYQGVLRTETMVVLSTHTERVRIPLDVDGRRPPKRPRRGGDARLRRA